MVSKRICPIPNDRQSVIHHVHVSTLFLAQVIFLIIHLFHYTAATEMSLENRNQTLYDYYGKPTISSGLADTDRKFYLNGKEITIISGSMHYFRVPKAYWRDRLRKFRSAGLNAVETYVPWNLHEPQHGVYDFGNGGSEFEDFLDLKTFLQEAQEEDLLVIVRPGPYICAEWEFGGLPSWLLRDEEIRIRTSDTKFMGHVKSYFGKLFEILSPLQFTKNGPIIAFQIENEYGNVKESHKDAGVDNKYLELVRDLMKGLGVVELLFTSDTPSNGNAGQIPGILYTANFQSDARKELDLLQTYQSNRATMVMEYWTGWFDHWTDKHHERSNEDFRAVLRDILSYPASVNMYMFHGGTTWGFLNGANIMCQSNKCNYLPDTNSYDYDAPLSENGDFTDKYFTVRSLAEEFYKRINVSIPPLPPRPEAVKYESIQIEYYLPLQDLLEQSAERIIKSNRLLTMEELNINNNNGQSYGFMWISSGLEGVPIEADSELKIFGKIRDSVMVYFNGELKSPVLRNVDDLNHFGYWKLDDPQLQITNISQTSKNNTLGMLVENWGRNNFGTLKQFDQKKGIVGERRITFNGKVVDNWNIIPLEFKKDWINVLKNWRKFDGIDANPKAAIYKATLRVSEPKDTFVDLRGWLKGVVIVNGFVLSRYLHLGPQQTSYLPAPLLREGDNDIFIFEHFKPNNLIKFSNKAIYCTKH